MSILDLFERENGVDYGLDSSVTHQRQDFLSERCGNGDLLFQRSRAQHRSDYVKAFAKDLIEIDISLTTGDATDKDQPSFHRHRNETRGEIWTTRQIEHDIKPTAAGQLLPKVCESR